MPNPDELISSDSWILIYAPFRRDAVVMEEWLAQYEIRARIANTLNEFTSSLAASPSAVVLTQEAFSSGLIAFISDWTKSEPNWSALPFIVLLDPPFLSNPTLLALQSLLPMEHITLLQRPLRPAELLSCIGNAVSARKRQFQIRDHLAWEVEMRHELNHRVKNVLATVHSIYFMTARQSQNFDDFRRTFEGRLRALGDVHNTLVAADFAVTTLGEVADRIFSPYTGKTDHQRIRAEGPDVLIDAGTAVTLGLCFHELTTNAIKYGSLSNETGEVVMRWRIEGEFVEIVWLERGGPRVETPSRKGYGSSFLWSAVKNGLGGSVVLDYDESGLTATLVAPVSSLLKQKI